MTAKDAYALLAEQFGLEPLKSRKRRAKGQPDDTAPDAQRSDLPAIPLGLDTDRVVQDTIAALARAENTYARGGILVRVSYDASDKRIARDVGAPIIRHHTAATLTCELSTLARFERYVDGDWVPCGPPPVVLSAVLERGTYPEVRSLMGVASAPIMRGDGTVAQSPGYDQASGYLLVFDSERVVRIDDQPTREDAFAARDTLLDVVSDFPGKSPRTSPPVFAPPDTGRAPGHRRSGPDDGRNRQRPGVRKVATDGRGEHHRDRSRSLSRDAAGRRGRNAQADHVDRHGRRRVSSH